MTQQRQLRIEHPFVSAKILLQSVLQNIFLACVFPFPDQVRDGHIRVIRH
jgi:hypothetical protein